ncbi:MAG: putative myst histone acetyltransferase [Piptocephalis tieghemiana]|nr:MAG: putative myst histone acetyltransferase [Piptocephalis tieghemiana]
MYRSRFGSGFPGTSEEEADQGEGSRKRRRGNGQGGGSQEEEGEGEGRGQNPSSARYKGSGNRKPRARHVQSVVFGSKLLHPWYFSPYPEEYSACGRLHLCEFCLRYMRLPDTLKEHQSTCPRKGPPGQVVYQQGIIKVYEVNGHREKSYCQCLCLFAKLFLDHKTVYYDVEHFLFYILTRSEVEDGVGVDRIVAYFSKEKISPEGYNLACILTLPQYQRHGYGRFLIDFSYALSRVEGKTGQPERPLSDLGLRGYYSYWRASLAHTLRQLVPTSLGGEGSSSSSSSSPSTWSISLEDLAMRTGIRVEDCASTLGATGLARCRDRGEGTVAIVSVPALKAFLFHADTWVGVREEALSYKARDWSVES